MTPLLSKSVYCWEQENGSILLCVWYDVTEIWTNKKDYQKNYIIRYLSQYPFNATWFYESNPCNALSSISYGGKHKVKLNCNKHRCKSVPVLSTTTVSLIFSPRSFMRGTFSKFPLYHTITKMAAAWLCYYRPTGN